MRNTITISLLLLVLHYSLGKGDKYTVVINGDTKHGVIAIVTLDPAGGQQGQLEITSNDRMVVLADVGTAVNQGNVKLLDETDSQISPDLYIIINASTPPGLQKPLQAKCLTLKYDKLEYFGRAICS